MDDIEIKQKNDKLMGLIKQHCGALYEHFDTVQIFCQKHDHEHQRGTVKFDHGSGNYYARYGQAKHWVIVEEEYSKRGE